MEVRAEGLWKSYGGVPVLRDVTRTFPVGLTWIMAPSGAGKTTLLRLLLGLEAPDRGRVLLPPGFRWAAVFQEDRLLEHLSGMENLRFALEPFRREAAEALLRLLGLEDAGEKPAGEYSGGMKRRLALARALLAPSEGLVLDEPFTGLDPENRRRALELIRREAETRVTLLVTHEAPDIPEAALWRLTET